MNDERAANAVDRRLGQRVRTRRLEIGMSQERLAELLGVTFQQVQKYEKGVNRIAASRLFDIAGALDMPIARFFEGIAGRAAGVAEAEDDYIHDALATPEGAQLIALFASIRNSKVRRRVVELVKALADDPEAGKRG
jgi:transcriptional regulator with XRE-family HTH domain